MARSYPPPPRGDGCFCVIHTSHTHSKLQTHTKPFSQLEYECSILDGSFLVVASV